MSKNLNQDDVLGIGDEPPQGVFTTDPGEAPSKARKPTAAAKEGKAKKGLSTTTYFIIGMVVLMVVMVWWKMPRGSKSAGEVDQMTGSSMSLEQAPEEPQQSPAMPMPSESLPSPSEQSTPTGVAAAPQIGASAEPALAVSKAIEPLTPAPAPMPAAAVNPDAAELAVQPAPQPQPPVQQPVAPAAATPTPALQQQASSQSAEMEKMRRDLAALSTKVDQLLARGESSRTAGVKESKPTSTTPPSKPVSKRVSQRAAARPVAKAEPASKAEPAEITGVSLRAVVGESAWVMTSQGESKQVTVGDVIPGAGVVKSVNAEAGTVNLVDGRILR
ncbi:hypothetical protein LMG667_02595 [Xanthomonas euvesicatoria]|uniref:hypothetical protein n=1 Tax=Xanthomonas euvesicatoria TaxID=456327 RepID=UPI00080E06CC|nr:hypothetical protein [Xanthomonas euvesicatoria]OCG90326.1 hypothetical protein LMG667_02595 [Xanthomonas euvesicatoria]